MKGRQTPKKLGWYGREEIPKKSQSVRRPSQQNLSLDIDETTTEQLEQRGKPSEKERGSEAHTWGEIQKSKAIHFRNGLVKFFEKSSTVLTKRFGNNIF
jgi:hypothetical protein